MTNIPYIDFGDEENNGPFYLGRAKLSLDGAVWADMYSIEQDPFRGTDRRLNLSELEQKLGYTQKDDIDEFIDENTQRYDGRAITKNARVYYGINALRAKLEGMRSIWHYIQSGGIFYELTEEDFELMEEENASHRDFWCEYIVYIDS